MKTSEIPAELVAEDEEFKKEFLEGRKWGMCVLINVFGCNPDHIRNPELIKEYVLKICDLIDMKRYGEPVIKRFGNGDKEGYSFVQLIETSTVIGHFAEDTNTAYIDIFSCKEYGPNLAAVFTASFFGSDEYSFDVIFRESQ